MKVVNARLLWVISLENNKICYIGILWMPFNRLSFSDVFLIDTWLSICWLFSGTSTHRDSDNTNCSLSFTTTAPRPPKVTMLLTSTILACQLGFTVMTAPWGRCRRVWWQPTPPALCPISCSTAAATLWAAEGRGLRRSADPGLRWEQLFKWQKKTLFSDHFLFLLFIKWERWVEGAEIIYLLCFKSTIDG